jgi:hypothetical protein
MIRPESYISYMESGKDREWFNYLLFSIMIKNVS